MPAEPRFARLQAELAAWVRDPSQPAPAGIEPRRLAIYRELFFNNVRDFVETAFPVAKSLLPAPEWDALVRDFFALHRPGSPYFRDISLAFRQWLEAARADWLQARPWLTELLHYEWAELAADCAEAGDTPAHVAGDLLAGVPVLRAATWVLAYRWPVHLLGPEALPSAEPPPTPTFLLLWRDDSGEVRQLETSPLAARLVALLQEAPAPGGALLEALAAEAGLAEAGLAPFVSAGAQVLQELQEQGLIPGIHCPTSAPRAGPAAS